jgi:beta-phosphoglucomutase family hydrolase
VHDTAVPNTRDLGLPDGIAACLFDLDGVLTRTATLHAAAWKEMFDAFLAGRGEPFTPFDEHLDYEQHVDGKARLAGVRDFLASRGITLPEGEPDDPPGRQTVAGLASRKNELVLDLLHTRGVDAYEGSVSYVRAVRDAGLPRAVVSSSRNCAEVLAAAGLEELFDAVVDGNVAAAEGLAGKPAPDTFLAGARRLGIDPPAGAVFEDALAGVAAGRAGGFGIVVGVDRAGQAAELREHGADVVVADLGELLAP